VELINLLESYQELFVGFVFILGLLIGSFLNVVIHRLPLIMEQEWRSDYVALSGDKLSGETKLTLSKPRSRCPQCNHQISALENIPVVSYLFLRGRCKSCSTPISPRYPIIELLTALLSGVVAWKFGYDWSALGALMLTWTLIALTFIDVDHQLLPDSLTLPILWFGIFFNLFNVYTDLQSSVIGAMSGYLVLWSIFHLFKLVTGKEGMGYGDFKLLAALGAWLGWSFLPAIILLSSLVGAVVGISLIVFKQHEKNIPIPFGPYLATAGWISLIWGEDILNTYLVLAGLN
jgi:leader peptidase (prepilin peptidase)/N-methyltransferase